MPLLASEFDFHLPPSLIAQHPAKPRTQARLLDGRTPPEMFDRHIYDLPQLLREGDHIVVNDTSVIPAQLSGHCGRARIGITLDQHIKDGRWSALIKNIKRLKEGSIITFGDHHHYAFVHKLCGGGSAILDFSCQGDEFNRFLQQTAALALPPYIHRAHGPTSQDQKDYQTIFQHHKGAVAAPTAGLHFTPELTKALIKKGIIIDRVTLHVGAGTFLPVREDDVSKHKMHQEYGIISEQTARDINRTRKNGGRIIAIGTTSLRILESATDKHGIIHPFRGNTSIFILPGYKFRIVDLLMTNFHLPRSTLFMLVSAFSGTKWARELYHHAIENHYRFYSYGDGCLLQCRNPLG